MARANQTGISANDTGEIISIETIAAECGLTMMSDLMPIDELAASLTAFATRAQSLDEIQQAVGKRWAKEKLKAAGISNAAGLVTAAFRSTKPGTTLPSRRALTAGLPEGVKERTDLGLAHLILRDHGNRLRYSEAVGWLFWDGRRWARDVGETECRRSVHSVACALEQRAGELVQQAAKLSSRGQQELADDARREARTYAAWAEEAQKSKNITSALKEARTLRGITVDPERLDADPFLLNTLNGTVDLRTGELREHRPDDLITRLAPTSYDPTAACPRWEAMLERVLPDAEVRGKRLTGGDRVTARFLFKENFEFTPSFKLILAVNDRPEIRGVDHGIWRRMRLVPFEVSIPAAEQDRALGEKLRAESSGILAWALRGCADWQASGLRAPLPVTNATASWQAESNTVAEFVADCCDVNDLGRESTSTLFEAFARWCKLQSREPMDRRQFGKRLAALGYRSDRTNSSRFWEGLRLNRDSDSRFDTEAE